MTIKFLLWTAVGLWAVPFTEKYLYYFQTNRKGH